MLVGVADDGEGVEDVGGLVAFQAVQVEVQRVEAGDAVAAVFGVPDEGFAVVAEVAGEAGQVVGGVAQAQDLLRSEEHTSELQSLMRISYAVFCLKKKKKHTIKHLTTYRMKHIHHIMSKS